MNEPDAYAARHKDIKEVEASRSGAAFVAISDYNILENGSIVYGAGNTDHFRVVYKRITTKEARDEFRGSKYVQSDLNTVFRHIKKKTCRRDLQFCFPERLAKPQGLTPYIGKSLGRTLCLLILYALVDNAFHALRFLREGDLHENCSCCSL